MRQLKNTLAGVMTAARRIGRAIAIDAARQGPAWVGLGRIQDRPEGGLPPHQTRRLLPAQAHAQPVDRKWRFAGPYRRLSGTAVLPSAPTRRRDADKGHCGRRRQIDIEQEVLVAFQRSRCW